MGDIDLAKLQAADRARGACSCRVCGCTDLYACVGGCAWAEPGLCSSCALSVDLSLADADDAGVELPEYPPLPVVDGRLVLDELEAWRVEVDRRSAELDAALAGAVGTETAAVAARVLEFVTRRRDDHRWVWGYVLGRTAAALDAHRVGDTGVTVRAAPWREGYEAGKHEALGRLAARRTAL